MIGKRERLGLGQLMGRGIAQFLNQLRSHLGPAALVSFIEVARM